MKPTMALRDVKGFLVLVHSPVSPSNEDWRQYLDTLKLWIPKGKGQLIYSLGGMPSSAQRAASITIGEAELKARKARGEQFIRTAVMTNSTVVRGVATMFNWFFDNTFSGFTLDDWSGAFAHLRVPAEDRAAAQEAVASMKTALV